MENDNVQPSDAAKQVNAPYGGLHGWVCPKCGRVYSPFTSMCPYCGNETTTTTGTNITF